MIIFIKLVNNNVNDQKDFKEVEEISISSIDSFLLDDYAIKRKIIADPKIPFDDINQNQFNEEYEVFKNIISQEKLEE